MRVLIAFLAALLLCRTASAAPPLAAYGHLPNIERARLSPSGERYAFIATTGETRQLAVFSSDGKLVLSIPVGNTKVRDLFWAGEEHVLVQLSATFERQVDFTQALELFPVVNVDLKTRKSSAIFANQRSINGAVWGYYGSADFEGHRCGYFGGITLSHTLRTGEYYFDNGYPDLYRVDLDSGKTTLVEDSDKKPYEWVIAADGTVAAHSEYEEKTGLWQLYRGTGRDKLLLQKTSPLDRISLIQFGRTADTVLILDRDGDSDTFAEISLATGAAEPVMGDRSVTSYLPDPDTGALLGTVDPEENGARFFDATLQSRYGAAQKAFPDLQMKLESYSRKLDHVIVVSDGDDDSGTWWIIDLRSGKATEIGSAYPEITQDDVGPTSWFKYKAADGLPIEAVLTLPPGRKPERLPLVVLPHGGPFDVHDHLGFDWWAQAYASAGYAVLQPNFRASSGSTRVVREAGWGQWGRKMQTDLSDGMHALAASGVIDEKRACIVGASYGGYAALAGVTLQHGLYRCAVSVAGVSDLPDFFEWEKDGHGDKSSATRFWSKLVGSEQNENKVLNALSPSRLAGQADAPVLLIHGKDDTVVPIAQSRKMESALKSAQKPVEFLVLDGEDHWLSREATRKAMLKAAVEFVQKYDPAE